jgi:hypothetical protein
MNGSIDCTFILNGNTFKFRLMSFCSMFTAEVLAFSSASEAVGIRSPGKFLLCTDSLNAIQSIQPSDLTHPIILEQCTASHTLCKRYFKITLAWIPGHVGISGKEAADAAARDARIQGSLVPGVLSSDFNSAVRRRILAK